MNIHKIKDPSKPINVKVFTACGDSVDSYKQLAMLQWEGMYWLVPIEVLWECGVLLKHRAKSKDTYNILGPVSITVQQCIPIPSKTAKILIKL